MNRALSWLNKRGFNAADAVPYASKWSNQLNGLRQAGNIGYRIEYTATQGAHINVFAGATKGPHYFFFGNRPIADTHKMFAEPFATSVKMWVSETGFPARATVRYKCQNVGV